MHKNTVCVPNNAKKIKYLSMLRKCALRPDDVYRDKCPPRRLHNIVAWMAHTKVDNFYFSFLAIEQPSEFSIIYCAKKTKIE
jgi:hypothetical protein